jgi:AbrB family looped-hinge helix DNA binding protein
MSHSAKITSKGQTTIPQEVRDSLGLRSGDRIEFIVVEGGAMMIPKNRPVSSLFGILGKPPAGAGATLEDFDEAIGQYLAEEDERITRHWHERDK